MNFGEAVEALKQQKKVSRSGWNGKGMWLGFEQAKQEEKKLAYIFMRTVTGEFVPWLASQTDILAEDWNLVD